MFLRFSFITTLGLTYFAVCEAAYPTVLAFSFLNEIMREFATKHDLSKVNLVRRPYSFIEFGESCNLLCMKYWFIYINGEVLFFWYNFTIVTCYHVLLPCWQMPVFVLLKLEYTFSCGDILIWRMWILWRIRSCLNYSILGLCCE